MTPLATLSGGILTKKSDPALNTDRPKAALLGSVGLRRPVSPPLDACMEFSTFEIEFPAHVAARDRDYWLEWVVDKGGQVEQLGPLAYRLYCTRPRQLEHVGWALFQTAFSKIARVTLVSGAAQSHASAYSLPQS